MNADAVARLAIIGFLGWVTAISLAFVLAAKGSPTLLVWAQSSPLQFVGGGALIGACLAAVIWWFGYLPAFN